MSKRIDKENRLEYTVEGNTYTVTNTGDVPAVGVHFICPEVSDTFRCSDNYFWLDAQESREITVTFKNSDNSDLILAAWNAEETVFECCVKHQIVLLEMTSLTRSLEDVFLELTGGKEAQ